MHNCLSDPLFGHAPIRSCFSDESVVQAMVRVEAALARVQSQMQVIPADAACAIALLENDAGIDHGPLSTGVAKAGVPVPALVKALREKLSPEHGDWLHYGATSQDIVDSGLNLCYGRALDLLAAEQTKLLNTLQARAFEHKDVIMLARTRGQLATPITFGLRVAQWAQPLVALESELAQIKSRALRVQFGGASGSRSALGAGGRETASRLAEQLGLSDSPPWHTDRSAYRLMSAWLVQLVVSLSKIGLDISLSARGEIAELSAGAGGGSSTMPHKSNPVTAEALQSLKPIATACEAGLTASSLHAEERDGSMWPVEWFLFPVLFESAGAALRHASALIDSMAPDAVAMEQRIRLQEPVLSEAAVFALAKTIGRQAAVQSVTKALSANEPLIDALSTMHPEICWAEVLDPAQGNASALAVIEQIFSARG